MTTALACLDPTYTVRISTLPHMTLSSQPESQSMPWRRNGMCIILFQKKRLSDPRPLLAFWAASVRSMGLVGPPGGAHEK